MENLRMVKIKSNGREFQMHVADDGNSPLSISNVVINWKKVKNALLIRMYSGWIREVNYSIRIKYSN